ncbi:MAG: hypothetical protein ABIK92_17220 [Pseudomonadota bacterium]
MIRVFISGSMRIKRLDKNVLSRINNILDKEYRVIVGDADGVDSSIQEYLNQKGAKSVLVYCTGSQPRNNIGNWETKNIGTMSKPGTRAYFTAKDLEMANDCDYGLMVWDAKSTGTLSNAIELLKRHKKSLVYINKTKEFMTVSDVKDLYKLLQYMTSISLEKAEAKLKITAQIGALSNKQVQLFA